MSPCGDNRLLLGSYVLGSLDPEEAAGLERHLAACASCRETRARLEPLPGLLDLVQPGASAHAVPPAQLEGSVLAGFAAYEHTRVSASPPDGRGERAPRPARWVIGVSSAVAATAATVAVLAAAGAFSEDRASEMRVTLSPPDAAGAGSAQARLVSTSTGTEVELDAELPPLPAGALYEVWFARDDARVSAGTFTVGRGERVTVRLSTAARVGDYERVGITREPDGVDPAANGPSVVVGALPS